ncbi:Sugar fermentation stimulation protein [Propionibacterium ruminifibrarum]|uniref:Sugar fermentation stimulation protein n=1 Tax=Propionibacterium ruminifibrarum TaxID=1962131 RepID=A0A375I375_9ACTN|nr:DNA/RNA nuclease SfsA [Propionibacterium ruminifibrarum]SPF69334.1 Sugar fermentation stimulation protein [Propionibacterium ruminifibrarum]
MSGFADLPAFEFGEPFSEGVILRRRSQFTMDVELDGESRSFHCPTTGRIGSIDVAGRPCLVSLAHGVGRKTAGTVEALSLARPGDEVKEWIGINQNAANRYVEHYLRCGGLAGVVGGEPGRRREDVCREVFLGGSRLDFLVGDTFLEVKTPLQHLQVDVPEWVAMKKATPFSSTSRMQRHVSELARSLDEHHKAVLLTCFMYDNPGFAIIERSTNYDAVKATVDAGLTRGVEVWQANFRIAPDHVRLERVMPVTF